MEHNLNIEIEYAGRSRERRLPEGALVDGFIESQDGTNNGTVLQFHGCFWHGCPRCFRVNRDLSLNNSESMDDRYSRTLRISGKITGSNYNLIEKWECEFDEECKTDQNLKSFIERNKQSWLTSPLNPRDAFFGGRTGNTVKVYEVKEGEKIKYVDVCSLYPYICKYGKYPIGHPKLYVGEEECKQLIGSNKDITKVEGLIKCEVLPPRNLFHPVLPVKMHNKLLFPLCRTCAENKFQEHCIHENENDRMFIGTWVAEEVKKAVELGYIIKRVFEIWQYQVTQYDRTKRQGGLFHEYIDKFFAEKTYASGYPPECDDEQSRERLIQEFERQEGIVLDKNRMNFNAGLRSVAKLCLNSLWGKFGQRENMPKTEVVTDPQRLVELLTSPETEVNSILPVNDNVIYVSWSFKEEASKPSPLVNVAVAAYTTALARLKLLSELIPLGDRVLYYDTDSIIYKSTVNSQEYEPPIGPFLGDLTDELSGYGIGTYINAFVSGGPKFYAYKFVKPDGTESCVCKIKGIKLNYANSQKLNFKSICKLVTGDIPPLFVTFDAIRRTSYHSVITRSETKICDAVYEKRRFIGFDKSYPYGYKPV